MNTQGYKMPNGNEKISDTNRGREEKRRGGNSGDTRFLRVWIKLNTVTFIEQHE